MNTHADKISENKNLTVESSLSKLQSKSDSTFQFIDNGPGATAQRKLQEAINNSPQVQQLKVYQEMANNSPRVKQFKEYQAINDRYTSQPTQLKDSLEEEPLQGKFEPIQKIENSSAPIQRRLLPIEGNAAQADRDSALALFNGLANSNAQIAEMSSDRTVLVYITVNRSDDGGDARTIAQWDGGHQRTLIMIELNMSATETVADIQASLLHELILHGIPAYLKHNEANGGNPNFIDPAIDEELFDDEEAAEHGDMNRWFEVITQGLQFGEDVWVETCKDLVQHLGVDNPLGLQVCQLLQAYDSDFAAIYLDDDEIGMNINEEDE